MKTVTLFLILCATLFSAPQKELKLLLSNWAMLKPINAETADTSKQTERKDDQSIKKLSLEFVALDLYKGLGCIINLPYVLTMESVNDTQQYRASQEDLSLHLTYSKFGLTLKSGISIPLGYDDHFDSLWIGSGSYIFKSSISGGKYLANIKTSFGGNLGFLRYINDAQVGFGSYEGYIKSYVSKSIFGLWAGIEAGYFYKSINYKQTGYLLSNGTFGVGYGEPFNQTEVTMGSFLSKSIGKSHEIAIGGNRTVYRTNTASAITMWLQFKYLI